MNKIGVMIGTHLFETIEEAHAALRKYGMIDGTCETYLIELTETPYNFLLNRTKEVFSNVNSITVYQQN